MASAEAESAFGDGGMYLEKAIVDPRHVEMQVLADRPGGCWCWASATARSSGATRS